MINQVTDWLDNTILVGDYIIATFTDCELRLGRVLSFGTKADYQGPRDTIKVEWEKGNRWATPNNPTNIYVDNHRFVKYDR